LPLRLIASENRSRCRLEASFRPEHLTRLVPALADLYPESVHVHDSGLQSTPDEQIWSYALTESLVIVSKDAGFRQRSFLFGPPPKVIWIGPGKLLHTENRGVAAKPVR